MNRIDKNTALQLLETADLLDLGEKADSIRRSLHPDKVVTFVVDRNINYTNICINKCKFCAFFREADSPEAYVLTDDEIFAKIDETITLGGTQILLQGGVHPDLGLDYYVQLLKSIKERFTINVHGFSPAEICYLAGKSGMTIKDTLLTIKQAGLDSMPGGGAEILSDRVREVISPNKIKTAAWLGVMEEAHRAGMRTTATMMFGSIEGPADIIDHLDAIRSLQDRTGGFTAFIPWSFQPKNTELIKHSNLQPATAVDYLRVLALARIYLDNIKNIQASWVTQGLKLAQVGLRFGANDFGSTMIEENVVRAAGVSYMVSMDDIVHAIKAAGFKAAQRDTYYKILRQFE